MGVVMESMSGVTPGPYCLHCQRWRICRPRGLCASCYSDLSIRLLYPTLSVIHGESSISEFNGNAPIPPEPTDALPGTEEKVTVMSERASKRQQLHHPYDERVGVVPVNIMRVCRVLDRLSVARE